MSFSYRELSDMLHTLTLTPDEYFRLGILFFLLLLFLYLELRPKYFYIVRHGETELNKANVKQGSEGALSEKGKEQARQLGKAFSSLRIQRIYTSPYERAKETADIIRKELTCGVTVVKLLAERRNASDTIGKSNDDPDVIRVEGLTKYGFHEDTYRYADEENFRDLKRRAKKCLSYLARRPYRRMVVVTHHVFLHTFLSYLLHREKLDANDVVKLSYFNPLDNAGITVCVYRPWHGVFSKTHGWEVRAYNQVFSGKESGEKRTEPVTK